MLTLVSGLSSHNKNLRSSVTLLAPKQQSFFALASAIRVMPNLGFYAREENWSDYTEAIEIIDRLLEHIKTPRLTSKDLKELDESLGNITPDEESTGSQYLSLIQNSIAVIQYWGRAMHDDPFANAMWAVTVTQDMIVSYLQDIKEFEDNKLVWEHHFLKRELSQEQEDIALLKATPRPSHDTLLKLQVLWNNEGRSVVDLK